MRTAKELTEEQVKQIRESAEGQIKLSKSFGIHVRRVKLIKEAPSLEEAIKIGKGAKGDPEKPPGADKASLQTRVIPAADVKFQPPAPLLFEFHQEIVSLDRSILSDCYDFYKDVRTADGSFEKFLLAGAGLLWQLLWGEPRIIEGKPVLEVSDGQRISGAGQGETGNEQGTQPG